MTRANDPEWQEERDGEDVATLVYVLMNGTYGMGYDDEEAFFIFRRIIERLEGHMGSVCSPTPAEKIA